MPGTLAYLLPIAIVALPSKLRTLAVIFVLGGIHLAAEESLEDSLCGELVAESRHGEGVHRFLVRQMMGCFQRMFLEYDVPDD